MPRQLLTKTLVQAHIRSCFLELSKENEISDITVTMLTSSANCARSTFYNYYESIDHLLFDCISYSFSLKNPPQVVEQVQDSLQNELRSCVLFAKEYPRVVGYFLDDTPMSSPYYKSWHKSIQDFIACCAELLCDDGAWQNGDDMVISYVHFCCGGIERTLFDYVRKGCIRSVENCVKVASLATMKLINADGQHIPSNPQ